MPRLTALRRILARESRAPGVIVALAKCAIEQLIHDDRLAHQLFGCGRIAVVEKVSAPQLDRIDAEGGGDLIHVALDGKDGLRRAKAAKRAIGNGVGGPRIASECARWGTEYGPGACSVARDSTVEDSVA